MKGGMMVEKTLVEEMPPPAEEKRRGKRPKTGGRKKGTLNKIRREHIQGALDRLRQLELAQSLREDLAKRYSPGDTAKLLEHFTDRLERVKLQGMSPIEYMLEVMRDPDAPAYRRDEMAKSAAQYMHARLNSVEVGGKKNQPLVENNTTIVQVDLHKLSYEELAQRYTERITEQKPAAEIEMPPNVLALAKTEIR